jgi:hypothetical protein
MPEGGEPGDEAAEPDLLIGAAGALQPDLIALGDGEHVTPAEAVGSGTLRLLDEVDGALVLSLAQ